MLEFMNYILHTIAPIIILSLEILGIFIILYGVIAAFVNFAKHKFNLKENETRLILGEAFSLGLAFLLGSEIIKTVTVRTMDELIILGIILVLRVVLTHVIH